MPRHTIRRISMLLLTLVCFGLFLGQALAAENTIRIYAPVVLKPGQPLAVTPTGQPMPTTSPTATGTATATATITPSETPTATGTTPATATTAPSDTPTATHTATATTVPSDTPTATGTTTTTATTAPSNTPTATHTATATTVPSDTPTATNTTTATTAPSDTPTATSTPSATPTAASTPTSTPTATAPVSPALTLTGRVSLYPLNSPPQLYVVVLDVSGSMAWNFNGQAIINGHVYQCGEGPDPELNAKRAQDYSICSRNRDTQWFPVEERRIYVAKQALMQFIDRLAPNDRMQIIPFSGAAPVNPIGQAELGDPAGKAKLKQYVLDAGKINNDPYAMRGGAPTASGLYRARQLLTDGTLPNNAPNGQDYKQVVLLLTDSVPHYYRDINNGRYTSNGATVGWLNQAQDQQPECRFDPENRTECQLGYADTTVGFVARPITAMLNEGGQLQQFARVYAIGLAGLTEYVGLSFVASQDIYPWYAEAPQPQNLSTVLTDIYNDTVSSDIYASVDQIDTAHTPDPAVLPGVDTTTFGFVTLTGPGGSTHTAPIQTDPASGRLAYRFDGLAAGSYTLSAWVGYKGNDGITRRYATLADSDGGEIGSSLSIDLLVSGQQDVLLVH